MLHQPVQPMVIFSKKLNSFSGQAAWHSRPLHTLLAILIKSIHQINDKCLSNNLIWLLSKCGIFHLQLYNSLPQVIQTPAVSQGTAAVPILRATTLLLHTRYVGSVLYRDISVVLILWLYDIYRIIHFSYTILQTIHLCLTLAYFGH